VLLLPAALRARSATALLALALLLALTVEWPRSRAAVPEPTSLRLVVWNVASNPAFAEHLQSLQPDIALVQEAARPAALPPGYTWHETFDPGVLSRLPIETLPTRPIGPWTPPQLLLTTLPDGRRVLLANVRLVLPTPIVQLASFPSDLGPATHAARVEQFPRLRGLLEETARQQAADAVVLAGDFNTPGGARSLLGLKPLLRDVWPEAGVGWGATAPAPLPLARIDQCWISEGVRPLHAEVLRLPGSDHRLLLVDVAFYTPPRNPAAQPRR